MAIDGVLGVGGANGSTMACAIMRQLPLAFPKAMVTPVAATAAVQWYVAESDIAMFPTIGDIWLNRVTRAAMTNAAEAVAGMAQARRRRAATPAPGALIGVSSFGNLQPAVDRITARLEAEGFEVIHFHASGPGGRALEQLARRGELAGVIDLTTSELTDFLTGGVYSAGETRLTAAGAAGVPQVVVPGCLDFTNWWVGEVPERYRQRAFFQYNVEILLMRTDADELAALGNLMGERLRAAKGPVRVLDPAQRLERAHRAQDPRSLRSGHRAVVAAGHRSRVRRHARAPSARRCHQGTARITSTTRRSRTPASMS